MMDMDMDMDMDSEEVRAVHSITTDSLRETTDYNVLQGQYEHEQILPEGGAMYTLGETQLYEGEETFAVDLRVSRSHNAAQETQKCINYMKKPKVVSIAELLDQPIWNYSENDNPMVKQFMVDMASSGETSRDISEDECEDVIDYSLPHVKQFLGTDVYEQDELKYCKLCDSATNTDSISMVEQETQTIRKFTKDASVQTDPEKKVMMCPIKQKVESPKFPCTLCKRCFATQNTYNRHLKTHVKNPKVVANVRFTTDAKLRIFKKQIVHKPISQVQNPIIIQMPNTSFKCDSCKKTFPSLMEKNEHDCAIEPFPMTKCPDCPMKFFTIGGLNDHIHFVHKKDSQSSNTHYCIFCDQTFEGGFSFHLHLNNHLSPLTNQ